MEHLLPRRWESSAFFFSLFYILFVLLLLPSWSYAEIPDGVIVDNSFGNGAVYGEVREYNTSTGEALVRVTNPKFFWTKINTTNLSGLDIDKEGIYANFGFLGPATSFIPWEPGFASADYKIMFDKSTGVGIGVDATFVSGFEAPFLNMAQIILTAAPLPSETVSVDTLSGIVEIINDSPDLAEIAYLLFTEDGSFLSGVQRLTELVLTKPEILQPIYAKVGMTFTVDQIKSALTFWKILDIARQVYDQFYTYLNGNFAGFVEFRGVSMRENDSYLYAAFWDSPSTPSSLTVQFDASRSTVQNDSITSYEWSFGDGSFDATSTPIISHTYAAAGTYTVELTLKSSRGKVARSQTGKTVGDLHLGGIIVTDSTISASRTWRAADGIYLVRSGFTIPEGVTLTIEPGTTVKLAEGAAIHVNGTLKATGATFTWADGQNQWGGMEFSGHGASTSYLQNCTIEHASSSTAWWEAGAVIRLHDSASPEIGGCTIKNSDAYHGIFIEGSSPLIANNAIDGMRYSGIFVSSSAGVKASLPFVTENVISNSNNGVFITDGSTGGNGGTYQGNTLSGNTHGFWIEYSDYYPTLVDNVYSNNTADIAASGTITGAVVWETGTYRLSSLFIDPSGSLTIAAGSTVTVDNGATLAVSGTLKANAVKFTWADGVNEWNGIKFNGSGANGSRLENCVIEHAYGTRSVSDEDYKTAAVYILNASPSISGCTVRNSTALSGIYARQQGAAVSPTITNTTVEGFDDGRRGLWAVGGASPNVSGCTFTSNGYGVFVDSASGGTYQGNTLSGNETGARIFYSSMNPEFTGNTYAGNTATDLYASGTITGAVIWDGSANGAYRLSTIFIDPSGSLTIAAGSTVTVDNGATLAVSGTLKANAVKFTWADGVNEWNGIQFSGSGANGSRLENCVIEHAYGTRSVSDEDYKTAAVYILNASPSIFGCTVRDSTALSGIYARQQGAAVSPTITNTTVEGFDDGRRGLWVVGGASPNVSGCTFTSNGYGVFVDSASGGTYQGNTLSGNTLYSLYHFGNTAIDAKNNNWGDPSGPLDDSDDRSTGGFYNPNGKGNKVSDNVLYYPWTGTTITQAGTPTGLSGEGRYSSINLKWNPNTEASLSGYRLYYGTVPGSYAPPTILDKVTAHKITGLSNNTPYYLAISALNSIGAEGPRSSEIMVTPVNKFAVDLTVGGSGKGSVIFTQGGTACNTNCSVLLDPFTSVSLQPNKEPFSLFRGWSGACTGIDGDCAFYLDGDKEVTASFERDTERVARVALPSIKYYPSLSAAYADSVAATVVEAWGTEIVDALVLDKPIGVKIRGGFSEGYTANSGSTVLRGTIKVRRGKLSVERLGLRP